MSSSSQKTQASSTLKPAAELGAGQQVRIPTRAPSIAAPAPRCSPRRSSCAARSSASPSCAVRCRPAARSEATTASRARTDPTSFADLFGDKDTLVVYSYMFGPQRERPCPMCTSLLAAWDGEVPDIQQRVALAVVARSPIERLIAFKRERGWHDLPLYTDLSGEYTRDYLR